MASRAIIRGRKYFLSHLHVPVRSSSGLSSFAHCRFRQDLDTKVQGSNNSECKEQESVFVPKECFYLSSREFASHPTSIFGSRYGGLETSLPLGVRWLSQSAGTASTATAGQPKIGRQYEDKEGKNLKQTKEPSPEDCDQAVEGLSSAKAKAKAKQLQESQKAPQSLVRKFWAKLLGIGPALRAVASMSRYGHCL